MPLPTPQHCAPREGSSSWVEDRYDTLEESSPSGLYGPRSLPRLVSKVPSPAPSRMKPRKLAKSTMAQPRDTQPLLPVADEEGCPPLGHTLSGQPRFSIRVAPRLPPPLSHSLARDLLLSCPLQPPPSFPICGFLPALLFFQPSLPISKRQAS